MAMANHNYNEDRNLDIVLPTKACLESTVGNESDISTQAGDSVDSLILISLNAFKAIQPWKVKSVLSVIYSSGTFANSILIFYLIYYKRYRSRIFCVILSLCFADLGVCVASLLWLSVSPIILIPTWMCKVTIGLLQISLLTSSYHIVVFAALRFFQLVFPLASRATVTGSFLTKVCLSIWTADLIQVLVINSFLKPVEVQYNNERVYVCWFTGDRYYLRPWMALTWGMLPFLATAGFHFSKHMILLCQRSGLVAMITSSDSDQQKRKQTDARALALILILFLISLLPTIVQYLRLYMFAIPFTPTEWKVAYISERIVYINSSINPWSYMFAADSVRSDIRKMCGQRAK